MNGSVSPLGSATSSFSQAVSLSMLTPTLWPMERDVCTCVVLNPKGVPADDYMHDLEHLLNSLCAATVLISGSGKFPCLVNFCVE